MFQFTEQELAKMRSRVKDNGPVIENMKKFCENALTYGVKVPPTSIATWIMYFTCPEDSGELIYDYSNGEEYECSVCHKKYKGEPYLGAWWRFTVEEVTDYAVTACHLWLLLREEKYRDIGKEMLLKFADAYPGYEVHGGIIYNNPGRVASQTLCEGLTLRKWTQCYDMLKDTFTEAERTHIEQDLLLPSAQVLIDYRMDHVHNHECMINGALGMAGIVLERDDIAELAVNSKYGLRYQLQHGVLEDGFWFEGTVHYHYVAFKAFMEFEKMARHTRFTLVDEPYYKKMIETPLKFMQTNYHMPCLGDVRGEGMFEELAEYYEFPYHLYKDEVSATLLNEIYERVPRDGREVLLYGEDEIQPTGKLTFSDYHDNEASGLTIFHGKNGRYLLMKHGKFGGEHDHYDKLGIHFLVDGQDVVDDMGTVFYAGPHHYQYFKNTFTHNTVCIDAVNQPPCNGKTISYEKREDGTYLEAHADWCHGPVDLDSFTIKQWDDEAYEGVAMRRAILFCDDYFLEAFLVKGAGKDRNVDWIVHPQGEAVLPDLDYKPVVLGESAPIQFFEDAKGAKREGIVKTQWTTPACTLTLYSTANVETEAIYAKGPNNPTDNMLQYFIQRSRGNDEVVFLNVFETQVGAENQGEGIGSRITNLSMTYEDNQVTVSLVYDGEKRTHQFALGRGL